MQKTDKLMCKNRLRTLDFEFETAFFGPRADVLGANRNLKFENKRVTDAAWTEGINIGLHECDTCQSHPATLRNRPRKACLDWTGTLPAVIPHVSGLTRHCCTAAFPGEPPPPLAAGPREQRRAALEG